MDCAVLAYSNQCMIQADVHFILFIILVYFNQEYNKYNAAKMYLFFLPTIETIKIVRPNYYDCYP